LQHVVGGAHHDRQDDEGERERAGEGREVADDAVFDHDQLA
jgi:hypothetical protein